MYKRSRSTNSGGGGMGDELNRRQDDVRIDKLIEDVEELKTILNQIKGAVTFVKWMAAVIAAGGAAWAWLVAQINLIPKG